MTEYCLSKGYDNYWVAGPFDSLEEALQEGISYAEEGMRVHEVRVLKPDYFMLTSEDILETMDEIAYDDGYGHDGYLHEIPRNEVEQANDELRAWAKKYIRLSADKYVGKHVADVPFDAERPLDAIR